MVPGSLVVALVLATFALLFVERIGAYPLTRSVTAATGAVVVVALGAISPADALDSVDVGTVLLLFGMLAHVEGLARSGVYEWAATRLVGRLRTLRGLTLGVLCVTAVCSAVALNDAIVLLVTPVLVTALGDADADPTYPLVAVVLGANVGSVATPLGNPQNAYVLNQSGLTTVEFVSVLGPVAVAALLVTAALLWVRVDDVRLDASVPERPLDRLWAGSSALFLVGTFGLLVAVPSVGAGVVAASTGVLHVAWLQGFRRVPGEELLGAVDWGILVLFVGLFVLVGALDGTWLVGTLRAVDGGVGLAVATFLLSNAVSNVPATVLLSATVTDPTGWYLLAAVSTLAGNATPIASAATLIALDRASREGVEVAALDVVRVGLPVAVLTSALATALVLWA